MSRKSGGGMNQLIHYVMDDRHRLKDKQGQQVVITHNIRGANPNEWVREFYRNEEKRLVSRSDSIYACHDVVSWHSLDAEHLNRETLEAFAYHFIDQKYPDSLVVATAHFEKDHIHLHVVASGVRLDGKSSRISKNEFQEIKLEMDRFSKEHFPEIKHSFVNHTEPERKLLNENHPKLRWQTKDLLAEHLQTLYQRSDSVSGFLNSAIHAGIEVYTRKGVPTGVRMEGRKYRFSTLGIKLDQDDFQDQGKNERKGESHAPDLLNSKAQALEKRTAALKAAREADSRVKDHRLSSLDHERRER